MPGPNSVPNGDTRLMLGHMNEAFICEVHSDKNLDLCFEREGMYYTDKHGELVLYPCRVVSLRNYLAKRNRLVTGKTTK
jgi:hypothetical protein